MRRQLFVVSSLTAIAQIAGFLKLWMTAQLFGISSQLDGYYLALVVPTLIAGVLAGVLQTALFPVRAKLAAEKQQSLVSRFERSVLALLIAVGVAVAAIVFVTGPQLIEWTGNRLAPSVYEAALFVMPFAVILIPLNAVGDGLAYLLAMRDLYPIAAAAPIANALFGSALLAFWPEAGLLNLALGTVIGLALQVLICMVGLARTKFHFLGSLPDRHEMSQEWREMSRLSAWILPGVIFANLTASLPIALVATHGEGAASAFGYAWRFHQFSIQLLIMAAAPVLLAHIANMVAIGNEDAVRRLLIKGIWVSLAIGIVSIVAVAIFGQQILSMIFSGRFDDAAAEQVSRHWLWLAYALAPALIGSICAKVWQARGRAGLMSILAGFGLVVFFLANQVLSDVLGSYAVAAAIGISSLAVTFAGWRSAWRPVRPNIHVIPKMLS